MKVFKNILEIQDLFDVYFVDVFGVIWNGFDFYEGSKEVLENLVENKLKYFK